MTPIKKIFLSVLASILGFAACQKDDTLYYSNVTMGNIVDGVFISDQGNIFSIKEQTCTGILDTVKRAMILCDVLSKTGEDTYDIRLNGFSSVFTKAIVDSSAVTDPEILVEDPLMMYEMWYAGGYINMYIALHFKEGSGQPHLINLVRNDEKAAPGTYEFTLKHNAFGEVADPDETEMAFGGTYISFPAADMIKEDEAEIIIRWNSIDTEGNTSDSASSLVYKWKRGGYEQQQVR